MEVFKYLWTIAGVICMSCVKLFGSSGSNAEMTNTIFTVAAVILTLIGILVTVRDAEGSKGKLKVLAIHLAIWVVGYFLFQLLIIIIVAAIAIVVIASFMGVDVLGMLSGILSGVSQQTDSKGTSGNADFSSGYYRDTDNESCTLWTTNQNYAVLKDSYGNEIEVRKHGDGNLVIDNNGNLYRPW